MREIIDTSPADGPFMRAFWIANGWALILAGIAFQWPIWHSTRLDWLGALFFSVVAIAVFPLGGLMLLYITNLKQHARREVK